MVPIWSLLVACCLGTLLGGCFCRLKQRWSGTKRSYEHCEAPDGMRRDMLETFP